MNWTTLLERRTAETYSATEKLIDLVDADALGWKPESGNNWMTAGQLLKHLEPACGAVMRGFVTGDWDFVDADMAPGAEAMPTSDGIEATRAALAADREMATAMIAEAGEERLANQDLAAPWNPTMRPLGQQLLECVGHLESHKAQLFYYLKLQGKDVNTMHLWGLGE